MIRSMSLRRCGISVILFGVMSFCVVANAATLKMPAIFTDHAVLQQNAAVPVWGWAAPGTEVSVSIAGQTKQAVVKDTGKWRVDLEAMTAGGPHEMKIVSAGESITLSDILIGEVWLGSGQSNMQWSIKNTDGYEEELKQCANDNIRIATVYREFSTEPLEDLRGLTPWMPCTAESLLQSCKGEGFSAVSYYFAKYLQQKLGVPVGIINTSWGGTRIEPWTPLEGFEAVPALADIAATVRMNTPSSNDYQNVLRETISKVEAWLPEAKGALDKGSFAPALPSIASESALNTNQSPTALYNAMVNPLVPYANRGFIWYQGESNRGEGMLYRDKMEALIRGWRTRFENEELACYFVQLAPFKYGDKPMALAEIWEAQVATLDIPGTGMAVINDIGDITNIHPRNKNDVGKRLAWLALNKTYGQKDVVCDSPLYDRHEIDGDMVRVYFKNATELKTRDGAAPTWFEISAMDGVYRQAKASIQGNAVVLMSEDISKPVAVRFAWDHCAEPNLMNEAGLPASAFRAGTIPPDGLVRTLVPESEGLQLVYALDPTNPTLQDGNILYSVNNSEALSGKKIMRIAYFMYLTPVEGDARWVYVEMTPFTKNIKHLGVPLPDKGAQFQKEVKGLVVKSNVPGLPTDNLHGYIEAWACNYGASRKHGFENASDDIYDFDDTMSMDANPGYGCLQIHDVNSGTTLLAFNNFRAGRDADVGIGNAPDKHKDWTFSKSANTCAGGQLLVLVKAD